MKLFIYIPTYNRPKEIRRQLEVLIPQVNKHKDRVRLIVNDNASPNGINDELPFLYSSENIIFMKNCGNIGGNGNILLGFVFARADEFLWLLSDNDLVTENAVETLLHELDENIDFISLNLDMGLDFSNVYKKTKKDSAMVYEWIDGWVLPVSEGIGLISACLYNMKTFSPYIATAFYFHNSSFPHLAVLLAAAKDKGALKFHLLSRHSFIIEESFLSIFSVSDYSLSHLGMPLLSDLMPFKKSKIFLWGWLKHCWIMLFAHRNGAYYHVFRQSRAIICSYGFKFIVFVFLLPFLFFNYSIFRFIKAGLKKIKKHVKPLTP